MQDWTAQVGKDGLPMLSTASAGLPQQPGGNFAQQLVWTRGRTLGNTIFSGFAVLCM
jgi:hypothetical protein